MEYTESPMISLAPQKEKEAESNKAELRSTYRKQRDKGTI